MAQSYANSGGTGDRTYLVIIQSSSDFGPGGAPRTPIYLVDGNKANKIWFNSQIANQYIKFDFGQPRVIDESKWYQDNASVQGTWKFQGSNDDSTYTDVGSSFTLGGASPFQTITAINGNTTPYRYWKLLQTAGSVTSSPFIQAIEFQIDVLDTTITQYGNTYGTGDRTASLVITQSQSAGHGNLIFGPSSALDPSLLPFVDNLNLLNTLEYEGTHLAIAGNWVQFQFPDYEIVDEVRWWNTDAADQATWVLQGSNDGVVFSNIGSSQNIIGGFDTTRYYTPGSQQVGVFVFTGCHGNTSSFKYYRMTGVSGSVANDSNLQLYEIGFRIKTGVAPSTSGPFMFVIT